MSIKLSDCSPEEQQKFGEVLSPYGGIFSLPKKMRSLPWEKKLLAFLNTLTPEVQTLSEAKKKLRDCTNAQG